MTTASHAADSRPTILIVDDDEPFRLRLARALADRGLETRVAGDHDQALLVSREDPAELAVVDLKMPGRSGLELVKSLKELEPTTRIVVLTGYGSIPTAVEAMKLGALHYLTKPADADQILAAFGLAEAGDAIGGSSIDGTPTLARVEWEHIQRVLADSGSNVSEAARRLGLHRRSLQRKLSKNPPGR